VEPSIFLSILGYEAELSELNGPVAGSRPLELIRGLLGRLQGVHLDVIRPPYSEKPRFTDRLVREVCQSLSGTEMEIHVMAPEPLKILSTVGDLCVQNPVPAASVHVEVFRGVEDAIGALREIRGLGFEPGVVLDLATPTATLHPDVVKEVGLIHVMSVPAGMGGQRFSPEAVEKIRLLRKAHGSKTIVVDGGINEETGRLSIDAGADRLVVGSRITGSGDPLEAIESLRRGLRRP